MSEEISAGQIVGGSPKNHVKVMRADGSHYWRRTASAIKKGVKHHKDPMKKKMKRKSTKKSPKKRKSASK